MQKVSQIPYAVYLLCVEFVHWMLDATQNNSVYRHYIIFTRSLLYKWKDGQHVQCAYAIVRNFHRTVLPTKCITILVLIYEQTFTEITCWNPTFYQKALLTQIILFSYSTFYQIWWKERQTLRTETCDLCMIENFAIAVNNHLVCYVWPGKWIGCGGLLNWCPSFPDLNFFYLIFFSHLKLVLYQAPVDTT